MSLATGNVWVVAYTPQPITLTIANQAPAANAGDPYSATAGTALTLNGGGWSDANPGDT